MTRGPSAQGSGFRDPAPPSGSQDLVAHLARFAGALRGCGIRVGLGDELDAARALTLVDLLDRDEVHRAMRTSLKIRRAQWDDFDRVFDQVWPGPKRPGPLTSGPASAGTPQTRSPRDWTPLRSILPPLARLAAVDNQPQTAAPEDEGRDGRPGYSPLASIRRKPIEQCSAADIDALLRLIERMAPRLAMRRSRRLVPVTGRGPMDLRRSLRRAVGTAGELMSPARRAHPVEEPQLVVLCDTSGSMDQHARFLLAFVLSLERVVRRLEVFAFNTSLTRLTPFIERGDIRRTLDRMAAAVPDWSGGTKIGESLSEFVTTYLGRFVTDKTVVLIFSDGLDRGDSSRVGHAMRAIHDRARRVFWLNPLGGDARYQPTARAMQAALPFVDRLLPAHNFASLERVLFELTS